jgi:hypothetical protein
VSDNSYDSAGEKVRKAFPVVCKWFEAKADKPASEGATSEVKERFQRLQDSGISPCQDCPLCQGH